MLSSTNDLSFERDSQISSQESLPLSQETFQSLMSGLFELGNRTESLKNVTDLCRDFEDGVFSSEKIGPNQYDLSLQTHYAPQLPCRQASIPAVSDYPGEYCFNVFFTEKEPLSKKTNWTYSETCNRLYIKKDQHCAINFSTNRLMGNGAYIRAMLVYSEPKYSTEAVTRCLTHSNKDFQDGIFEYEHIIRSGCSEASYVHDDKSNQYSVCVRFEDPTAGQNFSSYPFHFVCFNSCPGGVNRRQLTLVFTLEKLNMYNTPYVVGRKCFGLKVCACPGRDRWTDEGQSVKGDVVESSIESPPKKKFKENHVVQSNILSTQSNPSRKKSREYIIRVKDEETYKFLAEMKKVSDMGTRSFLLHMKNCRELYRRSREQKNFLPILSAYFNYVSNSETQTEDERV